MDKYSRRSMLRGSLGLAAAATLSKPYIANAAAATATVWVNQGFVKPEDEAFKQLAADYMKISGNTLDYSIMPFLAQNQKTVSALTSGDVPDLVFMELSDGGRSGLFPTADRDLHCVAPVHVL